MFIFFISINSRFDIAMSVTLISETIRTKRTILGNYVCLYCKHFKFDLEFGHAPITLQNQQMKREYPIYFLLFYVLYPLNFDFLG